jgi:hypothetical protein
MAPRSRNRGMDRVEVGGEHVWREEHPSRSTPYALAAHGGSMMDREGWPLDAASAAALVARVSRDLDCRSEEDVDILLSDLLCAAWPTCWAQDQ